MRKKTLFKPNSTPCKGASRLLFLWTLFLTINFSFLITPHATHAQSTCYITLTATSEPSACQADGKIHCTLSDTAGSSLEQIRYSYIPLDGGTDSIMETSEPYVDHLRPGDYRVRVAALCATGLSGPDAYIIVKDSLVINVGSSYIIPTAGVLYNLFTFNAPYGIVPSMECLPTGKMQIRLERGTFPYTIEVWRCSSTDTQLVRTVQFDAPQHTGDDPLRHDYRHYYTIDSLDVGDYRLLCHDGCGYYMPLLYVSVPKVKHDTDPKHHLLRNSSGILNSRNIVVFREDFRLIHAGAHNDDYYYYMSGTEPMFEYRFINPTPGTEHDTLPWRIMPPSIDDELFLYDTMTSIGSYCEAWLKTIQLQVRHIPCPDTILTYGFTLYPQGNNQYNTSRTTHYLYQEESYYDLCKYHTGGEAKTSISDQHIFRHEIYGCPDLSDPTSCYYPNYYTQSGGIHSVTDGMNRHAYLTQPVHCLVTDLTTGIRIDTLSNIWDDYSWSFTINTSSMPDGDSIGVEITDDLGCPLFTKVFVVNNQTDTFVNPGRDSYPSWRSTIADNDPCPDNPRGVGVFQMSKTPIPTIYEGRTIRPYYGDTIYLVKSPESNLYNLRAYADSMGQYIVEMEHPESGAAFRYEETYYASVHWPSGILRKVNLPAGTYVWVIKHSCERANDTIVQGATFREPLEVTEPPHYEFTRLCTQLEITPTAGQFSYDDDTLATFFQIHLEDTLIHSYNSVRKGEPMYIGTPGNYILSMYALPFNNKDLLSDHPCFRKDTLVVWDGETIQFDYLYSYVCNETDSIGFVRARGKNGTLPYTYTLYDAPNGSGNVIGQNGTGDFDNLPIHYRQALSIEMTDGCHAHFLTNFTVSDLNKIRKGWAENELNLITLCEETTCHFYGIALGDVTYHWSGPGGFESFIKDPVVHIAYADSCAGIYHIEILGSGCGILRDSIKLEVIPYSWMGLARDTVVCPGTTIPIVIEPHGAGPFTYTVTRTTPSDTSTFSFSNRPGGIIDTLWETVVKDKVRYFVTEMIDTRCASRLLEDTVTITMLPLHGADTTLRDTVYTGELPYIWDGITFTKADSVVYTFTGTSVCDSTVTWVLSVIDTTAPVTPPDIPVDTITPTDTITPPVIPPDPPTPPTPPTPVDTVCPEAVDYDGNHYAAIRIDHYCWTQTNLKSLHYSDGRPIDEPMTYTSDFYPDSTHNVSVFGMLYTWYAAVDTSTAGTLTPKGHVQGICPAGWFLPDKEHYQLLQTHGAPALRSPLYWLDDRGGDNSTGFTALPAGFYNGQKKRFENMMTEARFWCTEKNFSDPESDFFQLTNTCDELKNSESRKIDAYSIRCILEE